KNKEASVPSADTPCCGTPLIEYRYCTTAWTGKVVYAIAQPVTTEGAAPLLVKVTRPCGGILKLNVLTAPEPKSRDSAPPLFVYNTTTPLREYVSCGFTNVKLVIQF